MSSGINVLDNKTELSKEFDRRKQRQQRRDDDQKQRENRSTFKLRLERQANKVDLVTAVSLCSVLTFTTICSAITGLKTDSVCHTYIAFKVRILHTDFVN